MNVDDLTIGEAKQLATMFGGGSTASSASSGLNSQLGKKVIIRTYSAGVHYGELVEKAETEVILKNARRLYYWKTTDGGLSISEVANTGLHKDSKACAAVDNIWLNAIEIIPCSNKAIKNIEAQNDFKV